MKYKIIGFTLIFALLLTFCSCGKTGETETAEKKDTAKSAKETKKEKSGVIKDYQKIDVLNARMAKLAPVKIEVDASALTDNQKKVLDLLVKAAQYMDKIFLRQVYAKNELIQKELAKTDNPDYAVLKDFFNIHMGPFDSLNHNEAFINLDETKPKGANYYPADITKEEFEAHLKANPADEKAFTSEFTVIRRKEGKLVAVPYNEAYKDLLEPAAKLLKEAAQLADNPSLKKYLNSRADAFASNDYYQSDIDWVLLKDHGIEVVIGPYEVYEDELFGYKAAFESFITLIDKKESEKFAKLAKYLNDMEKNLPIDDKYKNFNRGLKSPIIIADEVFTGGDTKKGVQTIAFNLPNDERVRESTGSKKVMLRNVCKAKFEKCWVPVGKVALSETDFGLAKFDVFFYHILMHEISHGLGPGNIEKDGKKTSVSKELKDLYATIEEVKADILGIYNLEYMIAKGVLSKDLVKHVYPTYLGGIFRSIRFGINEAHGGSNAIQLNYIMEKGGFTFDAKTGHYGVNADKIKEAVKQLSHDVLMIEATGDYAKAKELIDKYRNVSPQLQSVLDKVTDVPRDIRPIYSILQK